MVPPEDYRCSSHRLATTFRGLRRVVADLPTGHTLNQDSGGTYHTMDVINGMLIDLMATMRRLDQEKRVERIRQGLQNKRIADPEWKPTGKGRNVAKWEAVQRLMSKHPKMSADDIATLAKCGVATVYRIRQELSLAKRPASATPGLS